MAIISKFPGGDGSVSPTLITKTIAQNGTYNASSDDADGYSQVTVNVSGGGGGSTLITKTITENGTYNASSDNADGYSQVTVNVSGGSTSDNDLLFHFEGDYKNSGNRVTAFINKTGLTISSEQSKFGSTSLKCGTTQVYNDVAIEAPFALGTNNFTLDFWCYPTNLSSGSSYVVPLAFDYRSLAIYLNQSSMQFGTAKSNNSWFNIDTVSVSITNNQWHHIALVRDGTNVYGFLDGVKVKTVNFGSDAWAPMSMLTLGSNTYNSGDRRFSGYIDEVRLRIGQAAWTDDFTPPTQPYA